jgi:hypothetical protein
MTTTRPQRYSPVATRSGKLASVGMRFQVLTSIRLPHLRQTFSPRTTMGPRQSEPPPNADLTNDTDLAHNDHTITRDHNTTTPEPLPATTRTRTRLHPTYHRHAALHPRRPSVTA